MTETNVYIDARCRINYASYYVLGLIKYFGKRSISFSHHYFSDSLYNSPADYDKGLCVVINHHDRLKKVFIDFHDADTISDKHYQWCDVYGKINIQSEVLPLFPKIIAIEPSFAVNMLNISVVFGIWSRLLFISQKPVSLLTYLRDFFYLFIRRRRYEDYLSSVPHDDYIFAISTLWYDPLTASTTNKDRGEFLKISKELFSNVEGGFFYIDGDNVKKQFPSYENYLEEYREFIYNKRLSPKEYLKKTKKSTLVFNTPSVLGCHGWKLAEYLAMGKAIISTRLNNEMPGDFNGSQMVLINNIEELRAAIVHLKTDKGARKILEEHASNYFNNELAPEQVIKRIINKLGL